MQKTKTESNNYHIEKNTFTIMGCIIIGLCLITILACSICYFAHKPEKCALNLIYSPKSRDIEISEIYNLEANIQKYIDDCEIRMENRYQFYIEQKEKSQDILVICSTIMGIIIALFGFLGYKSLRDLEIATTEKAIQQATESANNVARETINKCVPGAIEDVIKKHSDKMIKGPQFDLIVKKVRDTYLDNDLADFKLEIQQQIGQEPTNNQTTVRGTTAHNNVNDLNNFNNFTTTNSSAENTEYNNTIDTETTTNLGCDF